MFVINGFQFWKYIKKFYQKKKKYILKSYMFENSKIIINWRLLKN